MSMAEHNLLVVDRDDDFVSKAKELFDGSLPIARSLEEASQTVESGDVRLILIGPSYTGDSQIEEIRNLHNQDPALVLILVAEEVTADLLRKGMRAGVSDVIEAPLDEPKIEAAIEQFAHDVLRRKTAVTTPESRARSDAGQVVTIMSAKGGSGKTVLTQGVAQGLGIDPRQVQSPTFTLIREHRGTREIGRAHV